ncbi:Atlastin [Halotydeus destructor]|nr:Atlastin [Halotydeus destructor]
MDTQGLFDGQLSNDMRARLFVISTLMSSVQIFNAKSDIQDDTLQYLKTFTDYGAVRGSEAGHQFQKLVFLIRDTEFGDYDLGQEGGLEFLKWKLGQDGGGDDVVHVRRNLIKTFKDVDCVHYIRLIRPFKQHMKAFVEQTLATDNLAIKRVEGHNMTAVELSDYVRKYVDKITANISFSESILHANQMASSLTALDRAYERFNDEMLAIFGDNEPGVSDEQFDKYVSQCTNLAYAVYNETALNHRHESYETTRENLAGKIRSRTRKFKLLNDAKNNKFKAAYEILLTILKLIKLYAFRLRGVAAFAVGLAAFVIPLVMASMATGTTLASIAAFLAPLVSSVSLRPFIWPQLVALFVALMRMYDE